VSAKGYGYTLAVCAEMVFRDKAIDDRVRIIDALGFAVEIWGWAGKDIDALAATGARFTSMTGYVTGDLIEPDGSAALLRTAEQSIPVAHTVSARPTSTCTGPGWTTGDCRSAPPPRSPVPCGWPRRKP
jgi:hydroxypyruvate isomerase